MRTPLLTFYTPTYRRPVGLAACLESVRSQTAAARCEQVVIPDHVGVGIDGMYRALPSYVGAVHGDYVHLLCDDDVLASASVVAEFEAFLGERGRPGLVVATARKAGLTLPMDPWWPPVEGQIDLSCLIVRRDVWTAHADDYGKRYEGDYDFAIALARAGVGPVRWPTLFVVGGASHGAPEPQRQAAWSAV